MRKLAHIERIEWIRPIENADNIELCGVLGWQCVIKKNEFKVGDAVVYIEVDSVVPEKPEFEFLRSRNFRVKTIKLKGEISQGLVLPISILRDPLAAFKPRHTDHIYGLGDDVTELLGVTKYLSPSERNEITQQEARLANERSKLKKFMLRYSWFRKLFLTRTGKSGFPYWVSKTDEERVQNIPHVLEQFKNKDVYITEKIDYQSGTWTGRLVPKFSGILGKLIPLKKYQFVVCSRNFTTNDRSSLYWRVAEKYNLEQILKENPTLTIQGEQGDSKVQGNKYGIKEPTLWVFNIVDHQKNYQYNYTEMVNFCSKHGLQPVPLIAMGKLSKFGTIVQELVDFSRDKSVLANIHREGIVVRCIENGKKLLSFKVINPDFLLKYE